MTAFVLQQIDYVFFVYGLSFFLLGCVCFYISRNGSATAGWQWLGAFGVFHGANQWLNLAAMSLGDDIGWQWLRFTILTLSFLCLCEFGRRATFGSPPAVNWPWTYALLLAGAASGAVWGVEGLHATTRYLLGFVGGLWTAVALWRASREPHRPGRWVLAAAAACFIAYAITIGLIVPPAPIFPANYINQASFLHTTGLPVQLFRGAFAVALAACLWHYMVVQRKASAETTGHIRTSLYIHGLTAGMVVVIVAGWILTNAVGQHTMHDIQRYFLAYARGPSAVGALMNSWQQQIATHRLVVIGMTGIVIFLMAGSLLSAQSYQDTNEKIMASERLYQSVVDNSPNCLQLLDRHGHCLAINPKGLEKIGRSEKEMLGTCYWDAWPPETRPVVEAAFAAAMQGRQTQFEANYLRSDGEAITWQVVLSPIRDRQGRVGRVVEIATDITDPRRAEADLRRAKEAAEAATRAKTEFLTNMSHEIRTPITAILGYVDLLWESDLPAEEQQHHLCTIQRNGKVLLELIDDILDVSKIEAGRLELERMTCSPWQIINDVGTLMRVRTDGKGLSLSLESEGPLPETIFTDPTRLRQILVNLVGNAVKFTEIGGVRIVARLLRPDDQEPQLQFDVIDTGIGMTPAQCAIIFRPFTQADAATNRKYGGTGLGLTISKRLASMLGGDIAIRSEPDKGSTFRLTIAAGSLDGVPLVECSQATPLGAGTAAKPRPKLNCRILLAEDGPDNQRLLSLVLKKAGAEVVIAQNGQEAVEMAMASLPGWGRRFGDQKDPFDLVLMDIQMPVMDGLEATQQLRQQGFTWPIIALSAHATTHAAQQCIDAGCNDYLTKPIDREALLQKIAQYAVQVKNKQHDVAEKKPEYQTAEDAKDAERGNAGLEISDLRSSS